MNKVKYGRTYGKIRDGRVEVVKNKELTKREKEIYWKGFDDGVKGSLKHNIILMKEQIKGEENGN